MPDCVAERGRFESPRLFRIKEEEFERGGMFASGKGHSAA